MSAYWFVLVGLCNHVCLCLTQPYTYSMYIIYICIIMCVYNIYIYIYGCLTLAFVFWLTGLTPPLHLVAKKNAFRIRWLFVGRSKWRYLVELWHLASIAASRMPPANVHLRGKKIMHPGWIAQWVVGGWPTRPLWKIWLRQLGLLFPI